MLRLRTHLTLLSIVIVSGASCSRQAPSATIIEEHRIALQVQPDGFVDVTETMAVRSFARPPQPFERDLRRKRVDRFFDVRASLIGALQQGAVAEIENSRSGDVRVRWPAPGADEASTYRLQYRATGVLEVHGTTAWLRYQLLPLDPPYPIAESSVELRLPADARVVEPPAITGPGWTVSVTTDGMTARRTGVSTGEEAIVTAVLDARNLSLPEPGWQQNADRAREMAPAFLSGAFFIVVIGVGAIVMVWVQYPKRGPAAAAHIRGVGRSLLATGIVVLLMGLVSGAGVPLVIERYGRAIAAIPASVIIVGLLMIAAGMRLNGRSQADVAPGL